MHVHFVLFCKLNFIVFFSFFFAWHSLYGCLQCMVLTVWVHTVHGTNCMAPYSAWHSLYVSIQCMALTLWLPTALGTHRVGPYRSPRIWESGAYLGRLSPVGGNFSRRPPAARTRAHCLCSLSGNVCFCTALTIYIKTFTLFLWLIFAPGSTGSCRNY